MGTLNSAAREKRAGFSSRNIAGGTKHVPILYISYGMGISKWG